MTAAGLISPSRIVTNVEHNTPPTDPEVPALARPYVDILMADQHSPIHDNNRTAPTSQYNAANVARACATSGTHDVLISALQPSVQCLDILSYNSKEDHNGFSHSLLHVAQRIPVDAHFENEEVPRIKEIFLPYIGSLKSIQNLRGFLKMHHLVRPVKIIGGEMTMQHATAKGRLLFHMALAILSECHSKNRSWDGTFSCKHIRIIKPWQSKEFIVILKVPVEFQSKERLFQAMANDLRRAAEILIPLYKVGNDMPAYFLELKEDLEGVTDVLLAEGGTFMEYLSYHPAIMPSASRSTFMTKLNSIRTFCNVLRPIMQSRPYPNDWKEIVESEIDGNKNAKDPIEILNDVYYYNCQPGKEYENTRRGLSRFLRNVLEHGKQHDARVNHGYELELYLAKMFSNFLPSILQKLLDSGKMEQVYGEDWSTYQMSKSNKWEPTWSS